LQVNKGRRCAERANEVEQDLEKTWTIVLNLDINQVALDTK
jgi:hypothetical protein